MVSLKARAAARVPQSSYGQQFPYPAYGHSQLLATPWESSSGGSQSKGYGQSRSGGYVDSNLPMADSNRPVNGGKAPLTSVGVVDSRAEYHSYSGRKWWRQL